MAAREINRRSETVRFGTLLVLLSACFLMGGASRSDVPGLIFLQPVSVICAAVFLLTPGPFRWDAVRVPLLLLAAFAAVMVAQLIPLPPAIWSVMPGHAAFVSTAEVAGLEPSWRPISLSPDLTLESFIGLLVPFAVLIGIASLPEDRTWRLLPFLLVAGLLSAFLGIAQFGGGSSSPFYLYSVTNLGSPVGFFSNRNHQAVLLAMVAPMLALWAAQNPEGKAGSVRQWVALACGFFLVPMILATGSRAGLALGGGGFVIAFLIWHQVSGWRPRTRLSKLLVPAVAVAGAGLFAIALVFSRDEAVRRMVGLSISEDSRADYLPVLLRMAVDFFPIGSGFGSFENLFRYYEPLESLRPQYLNHAHNDLIETIIVGGLPALLVFAVFLAAMTVRAVRLFRKRGERRASAYAQLGLMMIGMMLLSSLVDYPLRTPLMAAVFAIACGWFFTPAEALNARRQRTGKSPLPQAGMSLGRHPNRTLVRDEELETAG